MDRRTLLFTTGLAMMTGPLFADAPHIGIDVDGVVFRARHDDGWLRCSLAAPTDGWLAVGFNNQRQLAGTRFVIGAVARAGVRVEERVAVVPDHVPVLALGLSAAARDATVINEDGTGRLSFAMPHCLEDTDNPNLSPDRRTHLMLAWSHETEFEHHSAWRRHFDMRL